MARFTDNLKREWHFTINCHELRRIKQQLGWNLLDRSFKELANPVTLFEVLCVLLEKNAKERQVSEESLGEALAGDAVVDAIEAMLEAMTDFFPKRSKAPQTAAAPEPPTTSDPASGT